jgi:hypothetical protein
VYLAFAALFLVELVLIPLHAAREACVHRIPYCRALRHAWVHQFWCFARVPCCCAIPCRQPWAKRFERPLLIGDDGQLVPYIDLRGARAAHDRLLLAHDGVTMNAFPLSTPFLRDASDSTLRVTLEAELTARRVGALMRDASPSDLEAMLSAAHERRVEAAAPTAMRITDVTEEDELLGVD